jgi:hypothetical protein
VELMHVLSLSKLTSFFFFGDGVMTGTVERRVEKL